MWWWMAACGPSDPDDGIAYVAPAPVASDPEPAFDPALADALAAVLDEQRVVQGSPGATLTVVLKNGAAWGGASGSADLAAGTPVTATDRFGIGSITKTFVAAVILQLDAEGTLSIDDVASTWIPTAPYADQITIRQLLSHTSGLGDFDLEASILVQPGRVWTHDEMLAFVADQPLLFAPGTGWAYSNAGYMELGLVIEAATGRAYGAEIRDRLLDPLGLADTFVPTSDGAPDTVRGYFGNEAYPSDVTDLLDPSATWACGEMVSNGPDLVRWADALFGRDRVLDDAHRAAMTEPVVLPDGTVVGYGLGCFVADTDAGRFVSHSGSTMGYTSEMTYRLADGTTTASLFNDFVASASALDAAAWAELP